MKILVNKSVLTYILTPLCVLSPNEEQELLALNDHDHVHLRRVIQRWIKKNFLEYDEASQEKIKHSLGYYLAFNYHTELKDVIHSFINCLNPPPYLFFSLIWDELFAEPIPCSLVKSHYEEDTIGYLIHQLKKIK